MKSLKNLFLLFGPILLIPLLTACVLEGLSPPAKFDYLPPANTFNLSGLEQPATILAKPDAATKSTPTTAAGSGPSPEIPGNTQQPPGQIRAPLPASHTEILLTLREVNSGAVKHLLHHSGTGNVSLSGIPDGTYVVLAETRQGFKPPPPQTIVVKNGKFKSLELKFERIDATHFYYYWESDHEGREFEYTANEDVSAQITFLDQSIERPQTSASQLLQNDYNIILSNEDLKWTYGLASKLLKTINSLPHAKLATPAKFILTQSQLPQDIKFSKVNNHSVVTLNLDAFAYAEKKLVKLDGKRGTFFSQRLFHAMVHFFTNNGKNRSAIRKILDEKFGVVTAPSNYRTLTGESKHNFQRFHPNELLQLINAFSQMPRGYYKIPGLRYIVRRKNGHPHPLYPNAPAVAWPRGASSNSYIEFMDTAFIAGGRDYVHRLILHEKSHFLWRNIFSQNLRDDWIDLGKWFPNSEASSGWSTTDTTGFVSPYAHAKNPNEDMAESLSHYVLNPKKLLSVSPLKFNFIEQRIMNGYRYVSSIRKDLTFEVYNLFPDYDFPGKIRQVEVSAHGNQDEDKQVVVTIELTNKAGIQDSARSAYTRVFSPNDTFKDLGLHPVNGNGHLLRGSITIPKNAKNGYWKINNITVTDAAGNQRMEGIVDFGFKLYINNRIEDITPPQYVPNSMAVTSRESTTNSGKQIFHVDVRWQVLEDVAMRSRSPVYGNLISLDHPHLYRITNYGSYNEQTQMAHVRLTLTGYHPLGNYGISYVNMSDKALNNGSQYFSDNPRHEVIRFTNIESDDADFGKPVLDSSRVFVQASPLKPTAPDGSTKVNVVFYAKDDKSGLGMVRYRLMDPLGKVHFNYFYHPNFHTLFFQGGDPTAYKRYEIKTTLPKGSPPGEWGLMEIVLNDKAGNMNTFNFLETLHFELE